MPLTRCPHCRRDVVADRTGPGLRARYGRGAPFVLAARCPYARCAQPVFARVPDEGAALELELETLAEAVAWSPPALLRAASRLLLPCVQLLAFGAIPAFGFREAFASLRCGGIAWLFFVAGSLFALVPIIYFLRGLACAAEDALTTARRSRAALRAGWTGGLHLVADTRTYRSH